MRHLKIVLRYFDIIIWMYIVVNNLEFKSTYKYFNMYGILSKFLIKLLPYPIVTSWIQSYNGRTHGVGHGMWMEVATAATSTTQI